MIGGEEINEMLESIDWLIASPVKWTIHKDVFTCFKSEAASTTNGFSGKESSSI
ncbi:hypothetical protein AN958_11938 [Leucoagaricus sp. SymC.cos]|nr:hypothetical protein AN958_11938 [Leucoagaricus sp. SymC.cos]